MMVLKHRRVASFSRAARLVVLMKHLCHEGNIVKKSLTNRFGGRCGEWKESLLPGGSLGRGFEFDIGTSALRAVKVKHARAASLEIERVASRLALTRGTISWQAVFRVSLLAV
jgi:hypothetical protein